MNKKSRFTILSIAACIFTIVFAAGFAYSISITNASGITSSKVTNKGSENKAVDTKIKKLNSNSYNILVMGDSLARGTGMKLIVDLQMIFLNFGKVKLKNL
ncbi:hypothetical protein ACI7YW_09405 [Clostridium ljungdahlii]|uniref:hypothetical protein n=1 Tax=Clostridium ljungdahlii TaxID=1538 RepID=UPI00386C2FB1